MAFLGVALGAFAAHILKTKLPAEMFSIFEVGVRYHFYHAFALFIVAWANSYWTTKSFSISGWLFFFGICVFSGSLYCLSLTGAHWLGMITPIGGVFFLLGWFFLVWNLWKIG